MDMENVQEQHTTGLSSIATEIHEFGLKVYELSNQVQKQQVQQKDRFNGVLVHVVQKPGKARLGHILWFPNINRSNENDAWIPHIIGRLPNGHVAWYVGSDDIFDIEEHSAGETLGFLRQMQRALEDELTFLLPKPPKRHSN